MDEVTEAANSNENVRKHLFNELQILNNGYWGESARWVRFEEDVEVGGGRWSKPFVATISVQSVLELQRQLSNATFLLDVSIKNYDELVTSVEKALSSKFDAEILKKISATLLLPHIHQHEKSEQILSILSQNCKSAKHYSKIKPKLKSQPNKVFDRKLLPGCEASAILIGEVDFLKTTISIFIRVKSQIELHELSEVPRPIRFAFISLGPAKLVKSLQDMGRSLAVMLSDEIFVELAYKFTDKDQMLDAVQHFFNESILLPPGEWDKSIRIEPPPHPPTAENRMKEKETPTSMDEEYTNDQVEDVNAPDPSLCRTGRLFGGFIQDIKRKLPYYKSDFVDGFNLQCLASIFFIFFASLSPIVTFGGILGVATENHMAAFEAIITGCVVGTTFHLFAGQPLAVLTSTGPVLIFEQILYRFSKEHELDYLCFRFWIGMCAGTLMLLVVAFDLSVLVKLITRFTEDCFACLVSIIFIVEAFIAIYGISQTYPISNAENLSRNYSCWCDWQISNYSATYRPSSFLNETGQCSDLNATICDKESSCKSYGPGCSYHEPVPDVFFFSFIIAVGTCAVSLWLREIRHSPFFTIKVRRAISDFAVTIAVLLMVAVDIWVGLPTPKLKVPKEFAPTKPGRNWLVQPFENPWWTIAVAPLPAFLLVVLLFIDQQIPAIIVNRKSHKLKVTCFSHITAANTTLVYL